LAQRFIVLPEYFHHLLSRHLLAIAVQDRRTRWLRLLARPTSFASCLAAFKQRTIHFHGGQLYVCM
jgi:hypothetical protein